MIGRCCNDNILSHVDRVGHTLCKNGCPLNVAIVDGAPRGPELAQDPKFAKYLDVLLESC